MPKYGVAASLSSVSRKKTQEKVGSKLKCLVEIKEIKDLLEGGQIPKAHTPTDVTAATSRNTQTPVKRAHSEDETKKSAKPQSRKTSIVKTPAVYLSVQQTPAPKTPQQIPKGLKSAFGKSNINLTVRREKFPHFWWSDPQYKSVVGLRHQAFRERQQP